LHLFQFRDTKLAVETHSDTFTPKGEAFEELVASQALSSDLKAALVACLAGRESRRWTLGELFERLKNLGVPCSKAALSGALGELELEFSLSQFLPWNLVEHGSEWWLVPKNELLGLLEGARKLPVVCKDTLLDEHKAVLLVVIGYRHNGGVSKTRIGDILRLDPTASLDELLRRELVYAAPGKELNWWRPTQEALLALGLRSYSQIPELKALERYFTSQHSFGHDVEMDANLEPILEKAKTSQTRRRRREIERRASVPARQLDLKPETPADGSLQVPSPTPEED
jgi:hypothetical protein